MVKDDVRLILSFDFLGDSASQRLESKAQCLA